MKVPIWSAVRVLLLISLATALLLWAAVNQAMIGQSQTLSDEIRPRAFKSSDTEPNVNHIFDQVNNTRQAHNLPPLRKNTSLTLLAQKRAESMQKNSYYDHADPEGKYFYDLMQDSGYKVEYGCENLDLQFTRSSKVYVNDWMQSKKGHRECLLNPRVEEAGYAVVRIKPMGGEDVPTYIVVAIHSTQPNFSLLSI